MNEQEPLDPRLLHENEPPNAKIRTIFVSFWLAWLFWFVVLGMGVGIGVGVALLSFYTADRIVFLIIGGGIIASSLFLAIVSTRDLRRGRRGE